MVAMRCVSCDDVMSEVRGRGCDDNSARRDMICGKSMCVFIPIRTLSLLGHHANQDTVLIRTPC